ncbi:hypothetical protein AC578_2204 [Pseudocercospora eumusae]|uniref:Uncharacterized protein n=1 Tax=Pseudocercospora eumusae TaxID=321146 RepID=A0A139HAV3_9PEZI|nr:hypothetical protein AC578_2204 [Pseudocercospora eumusae]
MSTTSTTTSVLRRIRLGSLKPEGRTSTSKWPNPEESTGRLYGILGKSQYYWEMCGKARESFIQLARDIKEHLEKHGDAVSSTVYWSAYMVGRIQKSANPMVFFCSNDTRARLRVRQEIESSGILVRYPGFRTGDCNRPPHLSQLRPLATGEAAHEPPSPPAYLTTTCSNPMGASIMVKQTGGSNLLVPVTVGAVLEVGESLYFTTVAHAFNAIAAIFDSATEIDTDIEFDFDDEDDTSSNCSLDDTVSMPELFAPAASQQPHEDHSEGLQISSAISAVEEAPNQSDSSNGTPFYTQEDVVFSSQVDDKSRLDYCLIGLNTDDTRIFKQSPTEAIQCAYHSVLPKRVSGPEAHDSPIVAYTGSRKASRGSLSGTPLFLSLTGGKITQELWSVHLEGTLVDGDCGSVVISTDSKALEGHIVAGSPEAGTALIVPAYQVMEDLQQRFNNKIRLSEQCEGCLPNSCSSSKSASEEELPTWNERRITVPRASTVKIFDQPERNPLPSDWANDLTMQFRRHLLEKRLEKLALYPQPRQGSKEHDKPRCSNCNSPTTGLGMVAPLPDESARGAQAVELYQCISQNCMSYERFPRHNDAFVLLQGEEVE